MESRLSHFHISGIGSFEINQIYQGFRWQERFHDNIIRNEFALDKIRQYIINNPINWKRDREQPPHQPL
ncbi:hypothetical protein [Nostoc sp.]|uniref:hypothetical protein n=1 Tax=Nostoc sp. TaxID=1180 RepID=UPI002FFAC6AE